MPEEIYLSPEQEEALDRAWAKLEQEDRLLQDSTAAPSPVPTEAEKRPILEPKQRELTDDEKEQIWHRIERGAADIYLLAQEFGCSASLIAEIKEARTDENWRTIMAFASRQLTITQGNLDNSHMYLTEVMDLFPEDVLGGHDESQAAPRTVRVLCGDEVVDTDIVQEKHIFRRRGWVRRFFDANRVAAGDRVLLEQMEPYVYRVSKESESPNKPLQQTGPASRLSEVPCPSGRPGC